MIGCKFPFSSNSRYFRPSVVSQKPKSTSRDILDAFDGLELLDELLQAAGVVEHDGEGAVEESVVAVDTDAPQEDFLFLTYYISDVVDDADVVVADDAKGDGVLAAALACPLRFDDSVAETLSKLRSIGAVLSVNLDAAAAGDEAKDSIAIDWLTASCHLEVEAFEVLVDDEDV